MAWLGPRAKNRAGLLSRIFLRYSGLRVSRTLGRTSLIVFGIQAGLTFPIMLQAAPSVSFDNLFPVDIRVLTNRA